MRLHTTSRLQKSCPQIYAQHPPGSRKSMTQGHSYINYGLHPGATQTLLLAPNNISKISSPIGRINRISPNTKADLLNVPYQRSRYNPKTRQEATATTSKPRGASSMLNALRGPARRSE
ncbi:Uncharacterized protein Rs2_41064 [Raphanus sativus]|nr:Uncharacterized protein Rs2_41064 [Raphanus sativus]